MPIHRMKLRQVLVKQRTTGSVVRKAYSILVLRRRYKKNIFAKSFFSFFSFTVIKL